MKKGFAYPSLLFILILTLYLLTSARTVPPYRDSGELITGAATLSVAHSPGYPLYMVLGRAAISAGGLFGLNPAFSMNLLSSFAGALASLTLYLILMDITKDRWVSIYGALLSSFAYINWYLSVVSEMYTLSLFCALLFIYLFLKEKIFLLAFILGLALGNHLTVLFVFLPIGVHLLYKKEYKRSSILKCFLFFLTGFSVYIYHFIRARADAFINWGDPSSITRFIRVITRAAYGHTLDLVSREVTLSEVFLPQMRYFGYSLLRDLTPVGIALVLIGVFILLRSKKERYLGLILFFIFFLTGPYFIYLARLPANPHALAIIEVGYMVPVAVLSIFAAMGLKVLSGSKIRMIIYPLACVFLIAGSLRTYIRVDMSDNYFAEDYAYNILSSVGDASVVILRKDHTLFALWYKQFMGYKPDTMIISKGLLSADWYRDKLRKDYPVFRIPEYIDDTDFIQKLYRLYPVYMTPTSASELSGDFFSRYSLLNHGLMLKMADGGSSNNPSDTLEFIREKYRFRGEYNTAAHYDFFTSDIIREYSSFYSRLGASLVREGELSAGRKILVKAIEMAPEEPGARFNLGYSYFSSGDYREASHYYAQAALLAEERLKRYTRREHFYPETADIFNALGASYERKLKSSENAQLAEKALDAYRRALEYSPRNSGIYYNIGVLYWSLDEWDKVVENFERALEFDPGNAAIMRYLETARNNLRMKG